MPNYRRSQVRGGTFFFTVVTYSRLPLFKNINNIRIIRKIISDVSDELQFEEIACVVLHDHIHSVWQLPEDDDNFSKRWGIIKSRFTRHLRSNGYEGQVWQNRFWEHTIKNADDLTAHIDYIHYNPLKHGYVDNVIDWPYSSFKRYVDTGYYSSDWGRDVAINDRGEFGE